MNDDPTQVLEALKAGDTEAQAHFWRRHSSDVYTICAGVLGPGADAGEVADGVLVDFLLKYVHTITHPGAVWSYLRLMATRRSARRRGRRESHEPINFERLPHDAGLTAEERASYKLLLPRLERCLRLLTPKAQQVLRLRFGGELTNEKIGSLVGGSKQYIGRLTRKSLDALRECIEEAVPAEGPR